MPSIAIIVGVPLLLLFINGVAFVYQLFKHAVRGYIHLQGMETYKDWPDDLFWELRDYLREYRPAYAVRSNADLVKLLLAAELIGHDEEPKGGEGVIVYNFRLKEINAPCSLIIVTNDRGRGGPTVYEMYVTD